MCADKNIEKGATAFGVAICGIIVAILGGILGFVYMLSFPANAFNSETSMLAAYEDQGDAPSRPGVYYLRGDVQRTPEWEVKRAALLSGETESVELKHEEINAWFAAKFRVSRPAKDDAEPNLLVTPSMPNLYFTEETIHISMPTEISLFGKSGQCIITCKGHFGSGESPEFVLDSMHMNSAAIPLPSILGQQIVDTLLKAYVETDEYTALTETWSEVKSVEVVDGLLRLQLL